MSSDSKLMSQQEHQIQNWNTFFKYHVHDWHGIVTRYSPEGEIIESFKCIRTFDASSDGNEYVQKNHHIYEDEKSETIKFGVKKKPITKALYIENSFSWCSGENGNFTNFRFEIGFRHQNRRATAGSVYKNKTLEHIFIIHEYLDSYSPEKSFLPKVDKNNNSWENWVGQLKGISSDLIIFNKSEIKWETLENISNENNIILYSPEGISITSPSSLEAKIDFHLTVDWLVEPTLRLRGSRYYENSTFSKAEFIEFNQ